VIKSYGYRSTQLGEFVSEKHNHKLIYFADTRYPCFPPHKLQ
jgi:hypothetical protein